MGDQPQGVLHALMSHSVMEFQKNSWTKAGWEAQLLEVAKNVVMGLSVWAGHSASSDAGVACRVLTMHQSQNLWVGLAVPSGQEQFQSPPITVFCQVHG